MTWVWSNGDKSLVDVRARVDQLAKKKDVGAISRLALDYRQRYFDSRIPSAKLITIWAYASRTATLIDASAGAKTFAAQSRANLELVKPIADYEYARTRFLVNSSDDPRRYSLLGKRLLKRNPDDYPVKFTQVYLVYGFDPIEAKRLGAELLLDRPEEYKGLAVNGDVFDTSYGLTKLKSDLVQAKRYYELYLAKAPKAENYRKVVELRLKRINRMLREM